jgi:hypothetical protein
MPKYFSLLISISNAAFNEENDSTPASPYMGYHQPASAPADVVPGWVNNSWATSEWVSHNELISMSCSNSIHRCYFDMPLSSIV